MSPSTLTESTSDQSTRRRAVASILPTLRHTRGPGRQQGGPRPSAPHPAPRSYPITMETPAGKARSLQPAKGGPLTPAAAQSHMHLPHPGGGSPSKTTAAWKGGICGADRGDPRAPGEQAGREGGVIPSGLRVPARAGPRKGWPRDVVWTTEETTVRPDFNQPQPKRQLRAWKFALKVSISLGARIKQFHSWGLPDDQVITMLLNTMWWKK